MRIVSKKAQHIAEFALLVGMILVMLFAVYLYIQRGLQGRYKQFADHVFEEAKNAGADFKTTHYEPTYITQTYETARKSNGNFRYEESEGDFNKQAYSEFRRSGGMMELPEGIEGGRPPGTGRPYFDVKKPWPTIHTVKRPPEDDVVKKEEGKRWH